MRLHAIILALISALLSGCAVFETTQGEPALGLDATLEAKVKTALISATDVDGAAIGVHSAGQVVTLSGFTVTAVERSRAEMIARQVDGVQHVINRIEARGDGD